MTDIINDTVNLCSTIANTIQNSFISTGDVCVKIITLNASNGSKNEDKIFAHRIVLESSSSLLRNLIQASTCNSNRLLSTVPVIEINFGFLTNAARAFRAILRFLYTGEFQLDSVDVVEALQVAKMCQIREAEIRLSSMVAQNIVREEKSRFLNCSMLSMLPNINPVDFRLLLVLQLMKSQQHNSFINLLSSCNGNSSATNTALVSNEPQFHAISSMITSSEAMPNTSSLSCFMPLAEASSKKDPETVDSFTKLRPSISENTSRLNASTTESLVPSTDKEGWCRNKKYIKRVPNGFMCTVCRKTYGRYNSVSYHVTIYHRNPPIKCDEKGCQFTTREARYIHFHKYYRHHIALPDSIDLGSRKCPFCRHVSKSPAMLEKHINRHLPNGNRVGRSFKCTKCTISLDSQAKLHEHLSTHHVNAFKCSECNYRGRTSKNLEQHKLFKHSEEMFKKMIICPECGFKCSTESVLLLHSEQVHKSFNADCAERNADADLTDDKNTASAAVYGLDNRRIVNDDDQPICLVKPKK